MIKILSIIFFKARLWHLRPPFSQRLIIKEIKKKKKEKETKFHNRKTPVHSKALYSQLGKKKYIYVRHKKIPVSVILFRECSKREKMHKSAAFPMRMLQFSFFIVLPKRKSAFLTRQGKKKSINLSGNSFGKCKEMLP